VVADSLDDEFTAYAGWTMYGLNDASVLTDDGDGSTNPWTSPAAVHFRRRTLDSQLFLQFPNATKSYILYKAVTVADTSLFWLRCAVSAQWDNNASGNSVDVGFGLWKDNGSGLPASADALVVEWRNLSSTGRQIGLMEPPGSTRVQSGQALQKGVSAPDIGGFFVSTAGVTGGANSVWRPFFHSSHTGETWHVSGAARSVTGYTRVWLVLRFDCTVAQISPIVTIDFVRRKVGASAWIV
jgi:hypothetical protein